MGVFSIAFPLPGLQPSLPDLPARRFGLPKKSAVTSTPDAPHSVLGHTVRKRTDRQQPAPGRPVPEISVPGVPAASQTSHAALEPPPSLAEARLARTPEQLAEQEATVRQVRRCLAGDGEAWQQLVTAQHRRLYGVCYRFTGSAPDADDLTQEAFLKIYTHLNSFDPGKGSFQTWAMTLTRNLLVDHFRRNRLQRSTDSLHETINGEADAPTQLDQLADHRPGQEQYVRGQELRTRIQTALKHLSPELREAVILRDLEDMDYREIAQVLRIPEGTVKSRISRGRGELARLLQHTEGQVV